MKSGYKIFWTDNALSELNETYKYIKIEFTEKELENLFVEIDMVINLISKNPELFPLSEFKGIRRVVVKKLNTLYYRLKNDRVEILSFHNNRKDSENKKFKK